MKKYIKKKHLQLIKTNNPKSRFKFIFTDVRLYLKPLTLDGKNMQTRAEKTRLSVVKHEVLMQKLEKYCLNDLFEVRFIIKSIELTWYWNILFLISEMI